MPRQEFLESIRCFQSCYSPYNDWYLQFLSTKLDSISPEVRQCLPCNNMKSLEANPQSEKEQLFRCLGRVADMLYSEKSIALAQIRNALADDGYLDSRVETHSAGMQCAFIIVGLLTMLYSPVLSPKSTLLEICHDTEITKPGTWRNYQVSSDCQQVSKPFKDLLRQFSGHIGPIPGSPASETAWNGNERSPLDSLLSTNVCFYTLSKLARVRIIWTEASCQHLEFDMRRKTLKLFRYPSFCALISTLPLDLNQTHSTGATQHKITHVSR